MEMWLPDIDHVVPTWTSFEAYRPLKQALSESFRLFRYLFRLLQINDRTGSDMYARLDYEAQEYCMVPHNTMK